MGGWVGEWEKSVVEVGEVEGRRVKSKGREKREVKSTPTKALEILISGRESGGIVRRRVRGSSNRSDPN